MDTKAAIKSNKLKKADPMTTNNVSAKTAGAFGTGIDALFSTGGAQYSVIPFDMIEVSAQIRENFEDAENTLEDLAASIKARGILQPILLRPTATGYALVAGERRLRASKLAGLTEIPAYIREMTDEEADDAQLAENIQRKNLTQIEEAQKIQRDLDLLGNVGAVLEKHQKGHSWLSKMLALLSLPEQAKRLVTENVSADIEIINTVKTLEKVDPVKAKALVDDLKNTRGKENARAKVAAVKQEVKPSKKQQTAKVEKSRKEDQQKKREAQWEKQSDTVATPKDRSQEAPSAGEIFAGAKMDTTEGADPFSDNAAPAAGGGGSSSDRPAVAKRVLSTVYTNIFEHGSNPTVLLGVMNSDELEAVEDWLQPFYEAGKQAKDSGRAVIQGFRNGQFSSDFEGAFALVAFLQGADSAAKFNMQNIFGSVKE